jgi:hypothetical protein
VFYHHDKKLTQKSLVLGRKITHVLKEQSGYHVEKKLPGGKDKEIKQEFPACNQTQKALRNGWILCIFQRIN